jgi:hypothetical protein
MPEAKGEGVRMEMGSGPTFTVKDPTPEPPVTSIARALNV